ncbi:MAG: hypothetical protein WC479_06980 [Candidatus Izemoplasmatales bacterium]
MAYKVDGCDVASKLPKYQRGKVGSQHTAQSYIKIVRVINTGVRVSGGGSGSVRPETGQILPRGM